MALEVDAPHPESLALQALDEMAADEATGSTNEYALIQCFLLSVICMPDEILGLDGSGD